MNIGKAIINYIRLALQASTPATPETGYVNLYSKSGNLYLLGADGIEVQVGGSAARDYILVRDEMPSGTMGGVFPSGTWNTRRLTVVSSDFGGHCSLSSNQITLATGTYEFSAIVPAMNIETHQAALYNVTDDVYYYGTSSMSRDIDTAVSTIDGKFSISSPKVFEVRDYSNSGNGQAYGMGHSASSGQIEVYSVVKFWRE